jgi:hypothetical protein
MPFPCHTTTMPFRERFLKATAQRGMGMAWHVGISIGRPETASSNYYAEFDGGCYQKEYQSFKL